MPSTEKVAFDNQNSMVDVKSNIVSSSSSHHSSSSNGSDTAIGQSEAEGDDGEGRRRRTSGSQHTVLKISEQVEEMQYSSYPQPAKQQDVQTDDASTSTCGLSMGSRSGTGETGRCSTGTATEDLPTVGSSSSTTTLPNGSSETSNRILELTIDGSDGGPAEVIRVRCPPSFVQRCLEARGRSNRNSGSSISQNDANSSDIINSYYRFKEGSKLKDYVFRKVKNPREHYTLLEVLMILKQVIREEELFDVLNPEMIVASPELEEALNMRGLHVKEIRELVRSNLELLSPKQQKELKSEVLAIPIVVPDKPLPYQSPSSSATSTDGANSSCNVGSNKVRQTRIRPTPARVQQAINQSSSGSLFQYRNDIRAYMTRELKDKSKETPSLNSQIYQDKNSRFKLSKEFREALLTRPDINPEQQIFSYEEVTSLLSKYILAKKDSLFDPRNIRVAFIMNDPLQKAFCVNAFHRCQVTDMLRRELTYIDPNDTVAELESKPIKSEELSLSSLVVSPFPSLVKASSMPASASKSCVTAEALDAVLAAVSTARKRTISGSQQSAGNAGKLARCEDGPTCGARTTSMSLSENTEEEPQQQQHDTDETDVDENGGQESDVAEIELYVDEGGETSEASEAVYDEYELDSGDEDERPPQAGGGGNEDSSDCSDVEDIKTHQVVVKPDDVDNWADSEMDGADLSPNDKSPRAPEKTNLCMSCGSHKEHGYQFCGKCWETRRGWIPERPKAHVHKSRCERDKEHEERASVAAATTANKNGGLARLNSNSGTDETDSCLKTVITAAGNSWSEAATTASSSQDSGHGSQEVETEEDDEEMGTVKSMESNHAVVEHPSDGDKDMSSLAAFQPENLMEEFKNFLLKKSGKGNQSDLENLLQKQALEEACRPVALLCMFCYQRPKDASLIHGKLGHQVCCYVCARKLWKRQARCPVCRRKIEKIVKTIVA